MFSPLSHTQTLSNTELLLVSRRAYICGFTAMQTQHPRTTFAWPQRLSRVGFPLKPPLMRSVIWSNASCVFWSARSLSPWVFQNHTATSKQSGCCATSVGWSSYGRFKSCIVFCGFESFPISLKQFCKDLNDCEAKQSIITKNML